MGRALLEAAIETARERGAVHMELGTSEDDTAARGLYESAGFTNREGRPDGPVMFVYERELYGGGERETQWTSASDFPRRSRAPSATRSSPGRPAPRSAAFTRSATIDRLVYPGYEPMVALGAAAAMTERIRLVTDILLAPLRGNGALLAKQAASLDALSNGRLTLGLGIGGRDDDFEAAGIPFERRGRQMDELLEEMKRVWAGEERGFAGGIGPPPAREGGPELLIGGYVEASARRAARFGDGFTVGGLPPDGAAYLAGMAKQAWSDAGREGSPEDDGALLLRPRRRGHGRPPTATSSTTTAIMGEGAEQVAQGAVVDEDMARNYREAYAGRRHRRADLFPLLARPGAGRPARRRGALSPRARARAPCSASTRPSSTSR